MELLGGIYIFKQPGRVKGTRTLHFRRRGFLNVTFLNKRHFLC